MKYCGSCNPWVDLTRIARHLTQVAEQRKDFQLVPLSEDNVDAVVILCGCPRACGNKKEVRDKARQSLVTAGESINRRPIPEKDLPATVERELLKIVEQLKDSLSAGA